MIQPKISVVTVCYNAVNDIGKMIRKIVLILLSIFFLSSCKEKDKKVVPPQLLVAGLHFTSNGYEFIGDLVTQKMKELDY